ncbi:MAG: hypothetical protein HY649_09115 [Acidobacteria bacterium]|nr:hypothetical protein [Acidobacteriota bacterium]
MLKLLIMGAVLVAAPSLSRLGYAQGPATTTVRDTIYKSDGSLASGTVVITWPAFVSGDGKPVVGGTKTVPLSGGNLAVTLTPNAGGTPSGTSYRVRYYESAGRFSEETWVVPSTNPLSSPGQPTVTNVGTPGTITYYYWVSATNAEGETQLGLSQVTTTSHATLDTNNYNQVEWDAVTGATGYKVYRTQTATVPSGTGSYLVGETATTSINDQSNSLQQATIPALNSTDPRKLSDVRVTAAPSPSVTLAASQVSGTAIVSNPDKTQTISAPAKSGVIPLQLKGHSQATANIFEVYDSQPSPALQSRFDSSGAFLTSKTPTFSTMSAGSALFAGTGGILSQDNTNYFWDNTAKRFIVGPRTGFNASAQSYVDASKHSLAILRTSTDAFVDGIGVTVQDSTTDLGLGFTSHYEDVHATGTRDGAYSIYGDITNAIGAGLTTSEVGGIAAQAIHSGDGTSSNMMGIVAFSNVRTAGAVGANYGIRSGDQGNVGAFNYGLYIDNQTAGANNWAIKTGTGKVQFGDDVIADKNLYAKAISQVRYAGQFAGGTAGAKIAAAIADLPSTGGTVDARGLEGAQTIATDVFTGVSKNVTILYGAGTYAFTLDTAVPKNITFVLSQGSILAPASGKTLTINGPIEAGLYQIFSGAGSIAFPATTGVSPPRVAKVYPEWWGAIPGDISVNSAIGIQAAINSSSNGIEIVFHPGNYYLSSVIEINRLGVTLRCPARMECRLSPNGASLGGVNSILDITYNTGSLQLNVDGLRFYGFTGANFTGTAIRAVTGTLIDSRVQNCWFDLSEESTNVFAGKGVFSSFENNVIELSNGGIYLQPQSSSVSIINTKFFSGKGDYITVDGTSTTATIAGSGALRASNRVTITTEAAHGFQPGAMAVVAGVTDTSFNGTFTILAVPSSTTFTYSQSGVDVASGSGTVIGSGKTTGILIDGVQIQEHIGGGGDAGASVVKIIYANQVSVMNIHYQGEVTTTPFASSQRTNGVTVQKSTRVDLSNIHVSDNLANGEIHIGEGFHIDSSDVVISGGNTFQPNRGIHLLGSNNNVRVSASQLQSARSDAIYVDSDTAGTLSLVGVQIEKPYQRGIVMSGTNTINIDLVSSSFKNMAYDYPVNIAGIVLGTSGRVNILSSQFVNDDPLTNMSPFVNVASSTGEVKISNNLFAGTGTKLSSSATTRLGPNAGIGGEAFQWGTLTTVTFGATPTFDAGLGNSFKLTLTANVASSTLSNAQTGQQISFLICQDGTGSRTFVWPTNVKGGMTIASTMSTCSAQTFLYDGTNAYALSSGVTGM